MHFENCADIDGFLKLGHIYKSALPEFNEYVSMDNLFYLENFK